MRPVFLQRMDTWARVASPMALTVIVVILNVIPFGVPDYAVIAPDFVLMAAFYWIVHRPDLMRPWGIFFVGLLNDILTGTPLGVNAFLLLSVHWAIVVQHKVFRGKSFGLLWCAFALVAAGAKALALVLALAVGYGLVNPTILLVQYALTVALYPPLAFLMGRAQRAFLPAV